MKTISKSGNTYAKARVHKIPTKRSNLIMLDSGEMYVYHKEQQGDGVTQVFHLYITTDGEIKEEDWAMNSLGMVYKCDDDNIPQKEDLKIIATTDPKLLYKNDLESTGTELPQPQKELVIRS